MTGNEVSYRQIMKGISIFGGIQAFNIGISIVRSKFIAVLLGPGGMGTAGLYMSTIGLIGSITNFGLGTSAVRSVSLAVASEDDERVRTTVSVVRRLVWITGLLGTLATLCLAPLLSEMTFGNKDYTTGFLVVSVTLLLSQLTAGQTVLLQGMRKIKHLAKADFTGMVIGLFLSVPLYYLFGTNGIVPAILISSFLGLFFTWLFSSKIRVPSVRINRDVFKTESITMLKMGLILSISGIIPVGTSYIIRIFIGHTGGVEQVGLYTAGFAVLNTYVGMIFNAMGTDYYPRLTQVSLDNNAAKRAINEQAEIAVLIIAPILAGFLTFINWAVVLLYSDKFAAVVGMLHWAALGMFFKALSWTIGFVFIAKGESRLFFWNELAANIYMLLLNIAGYKIIGLDGLGIAFLIGYALLFLQVFLITKVKYGFELESTLVKPFAIQFLFGGLCLFVMKEAISPYSYAISSAVILLSVLYSAKELNKRLNFGRVVWGFINKLRVKENYKKNSNQQAA